MKQSILILSIVLIGAWFNNAKCQEKLTALNIGSQVPDLILSNWLSNPDQKVHISDLYRHRLLILDFWATWCDPCISGLSDLDKLQMTFGDRIAVVAVGYESKKKITEFMANHSEIKFNQNRMLTGDTALSMKLFKHKGLPHLAWIDSTGRVIMTSAEDDVSFGNIEKVLRGQKINIIQKNDNLSFTPTKPFHLMDTSFLCRSILTRQAQGVLSYDYTAGSLNHDPTRHNRKFVSNQSISNLYWIAAFHHTINNLNKSRIIFEVTDSLKYFSPTLAPVSYLNSKYHSKSGWAAENLYCYDLSFPNPLPDSILYQYMIQDLNRYFNLNGRFVQKQMDCAVLRYTGNYPALFTKTTAPKVQYVAGLPAKLVGQDIKKLMVVLNERIVSGGVINETHINEPVTIDLSELYQGKPADIYQMNKVLNPYGLIITEEKRDIPVFVVSEY